MIFTTEQEPGATLPSQELAEPTRMVEKSSETFSNSTALSQSKIIVRTEEVVIVTLVLVLWVAAIALFFNRWGKIRMLEPYQPKFIQQHRPSCPLVDPVQHRSFSKFNISNETCKAHLRPRQNSVFVGSSIVSYPVNPPRRVKSAFDLKTLIFSDPVLNRSIIQLNLTEDLRRGSLRAALSVHPEPQSSPVGNAEPSPKESADSEVAHFERVQCHAEKEPAESDFPNGKIAKATEPRWNFPASSRSSVSESSSQDPRLIPPSGSDRRCSLRPLQKENGDGAEQKTLRRNSVMFINLMEGDRGCVNARSETIKSGVIDFRRNSMLIINNLNEDIGIRPFSRNMSLGSSNMALGGEFPCARRSSLAPPCSQEHKSKMPIPQVSIVKSKVAYGNAKNSSLARQEAESKFLSCQKPSKSLDSGETAKSQHMWRHGRKASSPVADARRQFLTPATVHVHVGSTASLNADLAKPEEPKPMDESRSTGNLAQSELIGPRIIETRCTSENAVAEAATPGRYGEATWAKPLKTADDSGVRKSSGSGGISLTTSVSSVSITSAIPLNVITSGAANKEAHPVEISHV